MAVRLNCWIVAMWLWVLGHCKHYAWIRRSYSFKGYLPHFGIAEHGGWKYLRVVEYIPPKKKWTRKNFLVAFEGSYRVWHFRLVSVRRHASKELAMADFYFHNSKE